MRLTLRRQRRTLADDYIDWHDFLASYGLRRQYEYSMHCPFPSNGIIAEQWDILPNSAKIKVFEVWRAANVSQLGDVFASERFLFFRRGEAVFDAELTHRWIAEMQATVRDLEQRLEALALEAQKIRL